jgi:hypothetical protein
VAVADADEVQLRQALSESLAMRPDCTTAAVQKLVAECVHASCVQLVAPPTSDLHSVSPLLTGCCSLCSPGSATGWWTRESRTHGTLPNTPLFHRLTWVGPCSMGTTSPTAGSSSAFTCFGLRREGYVTCAPLVQTSLSVGTTGDSRLELPAPVHWNPSLFVMAGRLGVEVALRRKGHAQKSAGAC